MPYNSVVTLDTLKHQRGVGTAEAEIVLDGSADCHLLRLVLANIDATFRILIDDIDRRRSHLITNGEHSKDTSIPPAPPSKWPVAPWWS